MGESRDTEDEILKSCLLEELHDEDLEDEIDKATSKSIPE